MSKMQKRKRQDVAIAHFLCPDGRRRGSIIVDFLLCRRYIISYVA